jgi:hypothetical protein
MLELPKTFSVADELPFESVSLFSFLSIARNYGERFMSSQISGLMKIVAGLIMAIQGRKAKACLKRALHPHDAT